MKCQENLEVHKLYCQSFAEFVLLNRLLKRLAGNEGLKPLEYLASCFVPECKPGEAYRAWLVRQVEATLRAGLCADGVIGLNGKDTGKHLIQYLEKVEFDQADADYIERTFGSIRDVQLVWQEAQARMGIAA